ncbi:MAG: hypothetical protein U0167_10935 [bacterium]
MHCHLGGVRSSLWAAVLALGVIPLTACNDERGDPTGPSAGPLNGNGLFGSAVVSSGIFRMQNHFAEKALDLLDSGSTVPYTEPSCQGIGTATLTVSDADPNTFLVQFTNFVSECGAHQSLTFNSLGANGRMYITFLQHGPGLVYEIFHPYDLATNAPSGTSCQLPSEDGGTILLMSTPVGALHYELDVARGTPGHVSITGTLRLEDRSTPLLVVEELALKYAFDESLSPKFADWPGGGYEIGAFEGGGALLTGGATPSFPVECFFDGFGGAAYDVENHLCQVNLTDRVNGNPCATQGIRR